jgi:hypothetical protein
METAANPHETGRVSEKEPAIELKPVKYKKLVAALKANKGKILVVDVWAEY